MGFLSDIWNGNGHGFFRTVDDIYQASGMNDFYGQAPAMSAKKNASLAASYPGAKTPSAKINAILANNSAKQSMKSLTASPSRPAASGSVASGSEAASQPQTFDYLDAPWASAYGMSHETAYSEAMENTAYRRSVIDMQKAGLNPAVIFGAGNGYTAGSPAYVSSAPTGSSGTGGTSGRTYRRGKSSGKLFSNSAYAVMSALGGIVGAAATKTAGGYWLGVSLTQGAMNAANLLLKR